MILVVKLHHKHIVTEKVVPFLNVESATDAILRKVLLRGKLSHKNYIYVESIRKYFGSTPDSRVISRTYRVITNNQPIMLITEKFPESSFSD